jgi:hypothetical protein
MVGAPSSGNYRTGKVEINLAISLPSILSRVYSWRKLFLRNSKILALSPAITAKSNRREALFGSHGE